MWRRIVGMITELDGRQVRERVIENLHDAV
jgi:hypothetical protein